MYHLYNREKIIELRQHRLAYRGIEKKLIGKTSLRGYLHDMDKLILLHFFSEYITEIIHMRLNRHHLYTCKKEKDYLYMIIDWESKRLCSKEKELNAYDTMRFFYPNLIDILLPILKEFKMDMDTIDYNRKIEFKHLF